MAVLQIASQTDGDGALRLEVGVPNATVRATLVVETTPQSDEERRRDWEQFIRRTAGSIKDPKFRRASTQADIAPTRLARVC